MTTSHEVTVWCDGTTEDGHDCPNWFRNGHRNAHKTRKDAEERGWTTAVSDGSGVRKDYCPDHDPADS